MKRFQQVFKTTVCVAIIVRVSFCSADVFHLPTGQTNLEFVSVGSAGNAADQTTGLGSVAYSYQIGKYDVTAGQYVDFLNAVAKADPYGLYYSSMSGTAYCNIERTGESGSYAYSTTTPNRPVNFVSFGNAARFCNWLTNGQPTGNEDLTTTEDGSYYLNGAVSNVALRLVIRKATARYVLPSLDEWYKAAYYDQNKPDGAGYWLYPTRSNTAPTAEVPPGEETTPGSANYLSVMGPDVYLTDVGAYADSFGPWGTFDQGGLLYQWTDTLLTTSYSGFAMMNSSFLSSSSDQLKSNYPVYPWSPANQYNFFGFRVAKVPEPSAMCLLLIGAGLCLTLLWKHGFLASNEVRLAIL